MDISLETRLFTEVEMKKIINDLLTCYFQHQGNKLARLDEIALKVDILSSLTVTKLELSQMIHGQYSY